MRRPLDEVEDEELLLESRTPENAGTVSEHHVLSLGHAVMALRTFGKTLADYKDGKEIRDPEQESPRRPGKDTGAWAYPRKPRGSIAFALLADAYLKIVNQGSLDVHSRELSIIGAKDASEGAGEEDRDRMRERVLEQEGAAERYKGVMQTYSSELADIVVELYDAPWNGDIPVDVVGTISKQDLTSIMLEMIWVKIRAMKSVYKAYGSAADIFSDLSKFGYGTFYTKTKQYTRAIGGGNLTDLRKPNFLDYEGNIAAYEAEMLAYADKKAMIEQFGYQDRLVGVLKMFHEEISHHSFHLIVPREPRSTVFGFDSSKYAKMAQRLFNFELLPTESKRGPLSVVDSKTQQRFAIQPINKSSGAKQTDDSVRSDYVRVSLPGSETPGEENGFDDEDYEVDRRTSPNVGKRYVWGVRTIIGGPLKQSPKGPASQTGRTDPWGTQSGKKYRTSHIFRSEMLISFFLNATTTSVKDTGNEDSGPKARDILLAQFAYTPPLYMTHMRLVSIVDLVSILFAVLSSMSQMRFAPYAALAPPETSMVTEEEGTSTGRRVTSERRAFPMFATGSRVLNEDAKTVFDEVVDEIKIYVQNRHRVSKTKYPSIKTSSYFFRFIKKRLADQASSTGEEWPESWKLGKEIFTNQVRGLAETLGIHVQRRLSVWKTRAKLYERNPTDGPTADQVKEGAAPMRSHGSFDKPVKRPLHRSDLVKMNSRAHKYLRAHFNALVQSHTDLFDLDWDTVVSTMVENDFALDYEKVTNKRNFNAQGGSADPKEEETYEFVAVNPIEPPPIILVIYDSGAPSVEYLETLRSTHTALTAGDKTATMKKRGRTSAGDLWNVDELKHPFYFNATTGFTPDDVRRRREDPFSMPPRYASDEDRKNGHISYVPRKHVDMRYAVPLDLEGLVDLNELQARGNVSLVLDRDEINTAEEDEVGEEELLVMENARKMSKPDFLDNPVELVDRARDGKVPNEQMIYLPRTTTLDNQRKGMMTNKAQYIVCDIRSLIARSGCAGHLHTVDPGDLQARQKGLELFMKRLQWPGRPLMGEHIDEAKKTGISTANLAVEVLMNFDNGVKWDRHKTTSDKLMGEHINRTQAWGLAGGLRRTVRMNLIHTDFTTKDKVTTKKVPAWEQMGIDGSFPKITRYWSTIDVAKVNRAILISEGREQPYGPTMETTNRMERFFRNPEGEGRYPQEDLRDTHSYCSPRGLPLIKGRSLGPLVRPRFNPGDDSHTQKMQESRGCRERFNTNTEYSTRYDTITQAVEPFLPDNMDPQADRPLAPLDREAIEDLLEDPFLGFGEEDPHFYMNESPGGSPFDL